MACHSPVQAFRHPGGLGKVKFHESPGDESLRLPCGRCFGCRLDRRSAWTVRCIHEAQLYDANSFVTLTYSDESLPAGGSLRYVDVQKFLKRLRRRVRGVTAVVDEGIESFPIRYFVAGEYGSQNLRPHYHLLMFNTEFGDRVPIGKNLFESALLSKLWPLGHASVGAVTPASVAYTCGYALKKVYGRQASERHYTSVNVETGEVAERVPEFIRMSLSGGIGSKWYEKFGRDVLPRDYVIVAGEKRRVPRFYNLKYEAENPRGYQEVKEIRDEKIAAIPSHERSWRKLQEAEEIALSRHSLFNERSL